MDIVFDRVIDPGDIRATFVSYHDRCEKERLDWVERVFPGYFPFDIARIDQLFSPVNQSRFDVMIVGANDAVRVTKMLRAHAGVMPNKPKILLVKSMSPSDRASALMAGFDDVIDYGRATPEEVVARVRAMIRRYKLSATDSSVQELRESSLERVADLSAVSGRERRVLEALLNRRGRPVSQAFLCEQISAGAASASALYLRVVICCLRKKLRNGASIIVRMGQGYELALDPGLSW